MKEYLLLFRGGERSWLQDSPEKFQEHMQKWAQWIGGIAEQGRLVGTQPLQQEGKNVAGPQKLVTDGPFMEGKEMVGGYLVCKAANYDEAVEMAKGCPILIFENGNVEVREIKEMNM